jgi:hypothetical protein
MITTMTAPVLVCIILPEVLVYNLSFLGILVKNLNQLAKIHNFKTDKHNVNLILTEWINIF